MIKKTTKPKVKKKENKYKITQVGSSTKPLILTRTTDIEKKEECSKCHRTSNTVKLSEKCPYCIAEEIGSEPNNLKKIIRMDKLLQLKHRALNVAMDEFNIAMMENMKVKKAKIPWYKHLLP